MHVELTDHYVMVNMVLTCTYFYRWILLKSRKKIIRYICLPTYLCYIEPICLCSINHLHSAIMDPNLYPIAFVQMDPIEIKDDEEHPIEMLVDQPRFLEPLCPEEVNEDTRVYPRVGDEYQVEVLDLLTEEEQAKLRSSTVYDSRAFGFEYPVGVGLAIPITWTQNTSTHIKEEYGGFSGYRSCPSQDEGPIHNSENIPGNLYQDIICSECKVGYAEQGEKLSGSAGQDMHCSQKRKLSGCSCAKKEFNDCFPLPGMPRYSWSDEESRTFLLGLYIFGKNLVQVTKFTETKTMGEVLSYYYGEFFRSDAYRRWAACRKARSRRCILGLRIFSGPRQQELLSRLLAGVAREVEASLMEVC